MKSDTFRKFFASYSKNVDQAERQYFWRLSDAIITALIRRHIQSLDAQSVIFDAGGGTGRWIIKLSEHYPCRFVLYDLSEDMLHKARENLKRSNLDSRAQILSGDLCNIRTVSDTSVDHIISIYNPLSFVRDPQAAIHELARILKPNGVIFMMGQGFPNAIASKINNLLAPPEELRTMAEKTVVTWTPDMPPLFVFTREQLSEFFVNAGLCVAHSYGIPIFTQPGPEDFDPTNEMESRISNKLRTDPVFFETVFNLEMEFNGMDTMVNRGMNIAVVAQKPL